MHASGSSLPVSAVKAGVVPMVQDCSNMRTVNFALKVVGMLNAKVVQNRLVLLAISTVVRAKP